VLVGAILGAVLGAKALDLVQFWTHSRAHLGDLATWTGGKTIVGGLLGGWLGVELAKRAVGIHGSTGDLLVLPLGLGIATGRLGCLMTGPVDHTFGYPVAWGWDGGDGIPRHPTPLYEALFLVVIAAVLARRTFREGDRFRWFVVLYLSFRVLVDFLKPPFGPDPLDPTPDLVLGLTPIQWAAAGGTCYAAALLWRARGARADA
jgi:prolipoprotein diacylglyceryltransferase